MRRSATAKSDSRCRHGGRWISLVGAPVKQYFWRYLSYPAVQLSSAISGTRSSSSSRAVTTRTPCASTSVPASAPRLRITVKRTTLCYEPAVSQESSSLPVLPVLEHARARLRFLWTFNQVRERSTKQRWTQHVCAILYKLLCTILRQFFVQIEIKAKHPHLTHFVCWYNSGFIYCDMLRATLLSSHQHERKKLINCYV